jgi:hypothetical protein
MEENIARHSAEFQPVREMNGRRASNPLRGALVLSPPIRNGGLGRGPSRDVILLQLRDERSETRRPIRMKGDGIQPGQGDVHVSERDIVDPERHHEINKVATRGRDRRHGEFLERTFLLVRRPA